MLEGPAGGPRVAVAYDRSPPINGLYRRQLIAASRKAASYVIAIGHFSGFVLGASSVAAAPALELDPVT